MLKKEVAAAIANTILGVSDSKMFTIVISCAFMMPPNRILSRLLRVLIQNRETLGRGGLIKTLQL